LAVFDVMQDITKETQIHIMRRQLRITEFPLDRLDILYVFLFCFLGDVIQKPRIDINCVNFAGGRNCLGEGK
jgi:hypothetical protein